MTFKSTHESTYSANIYRFFIILVESLLFYYAFKFAHFAHYGRHFGGGSYLYVALIFVTIWVTVSLFQHFYRLDELIKKDKLFPYLLRAFLIHVGIMGIVIFGFKATFMSRMIMLYAYIFAFSSITVVRSVLTLLAGFYQRQVQQSYKVLIVGTGYSADSLDDHLSSRMGKVFRFTGLGDGRNHLPEDIQKEKINSLKTFCLKEHINEIYYALPLSRKDLLEDISSFADNNFMYFKIATDFEVLHRRKLNIDMMGGVPVISLREVPQRYLINRMLKRVCDVIFSAFVIIFVMSWLYPLIALAIKLNSKGPILFTQWRTGTKGRKFRCFKFRTMYVEQVVPEHTQATKDDPRITRVGRFLRKTNLDEFPQFFNVLRGDMSVVGPRPHPLQLTEDYAQLIDRYLFRHFIMPGITGYAQIHGYRGETKSPEEMRKRVEYDTWYIENWSPFLDVKIVLLTVWNMVKGEKNAY